MLDHQELMSHESLLDRLDSRSINYRFDLDADIPWENICDDGCYLSFSMLHRLGFNIDLIRNYREIQGVVQWVMAMTTSIGFAHLERELVGFIEGDRSNMKHSRSSTLLAIEEIKHIELFERYGKHLRFQRSDYADVFDAVYENPPGLFDSDKLRAGKLDQSEAQWLFWLATVFFEEYTIFFCRALEEERDRIQPTWLAAHRCHRREEAQHVRTDVAYLEAIGLPKAQTRRLGKAFSLHLFDEFQRFFGMDTCERFLREVLPELPVLDASLSLPALPLFADLQRDPAFRQSRRYILDLDPSFPSTRPTLHLPRSAATGLPDCLERTIAQADAKIARYRPDGSLKDLTYAQLFQRARMVLGGLNDYGMRSGDLLVIMIHEPVDFIVAFWAGVLGGLLPAPLPAPKHLHGRRAEIDRLCAIHKRLGMPVMIVDDDGMPAVKTGMSDRGMQAADLMSWSQLAAYNGKAGDVKKAGGADLALVQFTSGSTGAPRGVGLTHDNVIHVTEAMIERRCGTPEDVFASWLPLSHDLGLIGCHLTPLVLGGDQIWFTPGEFLRRPADWFHYLSSCRATVTAGTSSSLWRALESMDQCFIEQLDLSRLHSLVVGAEPVSEPLLDRLAERLAPAGLKPTAICPAYGLAEATVAVTMPHRHERPSVLARDPTGVGANERQRHYVGVGTPIAGTQLRIINDDGVPQPDGTQGTLEISGPGVMAGYFQDPAATAAVLRDGWLRTGDHAFIDRGQLYWVGRTADAFSTFGQTRYATDIEAIASEVEGVEPGGVALVSEQGEAEPRLALFVAVESKARTDAQSLLCRVADHVRRRMGIRIDDLYQIHRRDLPRTTNGKLAREQLVEMFQTGQFAGMPTLRPASHEDPSPSAAAREPLIQLLREVWAGALALTPSDVGDDDEFTELGGDSLSAAEIVLALEDRLRRPIPQDLLLESRTIRQMAEILWRLEAVPGDVPKQRPGPVLDAKHTRPLIKIQDNTLAGDRAVTPAASVDPVAVVALAVRFPGCESIEAFWNLLAAGRDTFRPVPPARRAAGGWQDWQSPGESTSCIGSFLDDIELFAPEIFGIAEREAKYIDPQHRLFLEVCAEALDQAVLESRRIGIFAASAEDQYGQRYIQEPQRVERFSLLGSLRNMVAGRTAQVFQFTGPAMAVDTACSSSAVAIHLACASLRNGECDAALAGGIQLNLTHQAHLFFERAQLMSGEGCCRPFDDRAAGLIPGEGAGVVLLKPLTTAVRDGDDILGVIRSSAVNNDGGGLTLTAPSGAGQQRVIADAYRHAGIDPQSIGYVEAHAAGTAIGDAVELRSLTQIFGQIGRTIPIGSVKSNLGHCFHAAGIASVAKVLLCLTEGQIPPTIHCETPARRIGFDTTPFHPVGALTDWPADEKPRRAAINSFGLGGTNVHLVLEEGPKPTVGRKLAPRRSVFCLRAPAGELAQVADHYRRHIDRVEGGVAGVCSASCRRGQWMPERRAFAAGSRRELSRQLASIAAGQTVKPRRRPDAPVFVIPGLGGHLREEVTFLFKEERGFRRYVEEMTRQAEPYAPGLERQFASPEAPVSFLEAQLLTFIANIASARWMEHLGVRPAMLLGHSAGEYACAVLAGVMTVDGALGLLANRATLMERHAPGSMAVVFADEDEIVARTIDANLELAVAARNAPGQVVMSGPKAFMDRFMRILEESGTRFISMPIPVAAHSAHLRGAVDAFGKLLGSLRFAPPKLPVISTLTGKRVEVLDADYWLRQLVALVDFTAAVREARRAGANLFIEVGGSNGLTTCGKLIAAHDAVDNVWCALVTKSPDGELSTADTLATLVDVGLEVQLSKADSLRADAGKVDRLLPRYVGNPRPHWLPIASGGPAEQDPEIVIRASDAVVANHLVDGIATVPFCWLIEQVARALSHRRDDVLQLEELRLLRSFRLGGDEVCRLTLSTGLDDEGVERLSCRMIGREGHGPTVFQCRFRPARGRIFSQIDRPSIAARCDRTLDGNSFYDALERRGFRIGEPLRTIRSIAYGDREALVELTAPTGDIAGGLTYPAYSVGVSHAASVLFGDIEASDQAIFLGFSIGRIALHGSLSDRCIAVISLRTPVKRDMTAIAYDAVLASEDGEILMTIENFIVKRLPVKDPSDHLESFDRVPPRVPDPPEEEIADDDLTAKVIEIIAARLDRPFEEIDPVQPLASLGIDSLMAVELALELDAEFEAGLPTTLLFEALTVAEIVHQIECQKNGTGACRR